MELRELEVRHDAGGAVVRATLPGGLLTRRGVEELASTAESLVENRDVRVVVIDARAPDFCSGEAADLDPTNSVDPAAALADLRPPVIVRLHGRCVDAGLAIALACDVRVLEQPSGASFGFTEVARGALPPWGAITRLVRALGASQAATMVLLGHELDGEAALRSGLVHELGAADDLAERLRGLAPLALELAKEAVWRGVELPMREGLRLEGDLNTLLQHTADRAEGLAAFGAKRPPAFRGR